MWLLITFITIWAVSPGPVAVMTLHETRKRGLMAGISVSAGAALTSVLMVISALVVHMIGFSTILESDSMIVIERIGALGIVLMGLYAGYKSLWSVDDKKSNDDTNPSNKFGFAQGMLVMATYIPQALIYYNMIIPQTVQPETVMTTIIVLGTLKVTLIFGWHALIALIANRSHNLVSNKRFGKFFEISTACLIMALGLNILF